MPSWVVPVLGPATGLEVLVVLAVLVVAVWVLCCARLVQRRGQRAQVGARPAARRQRLLPEGHRPPPGLGPISPSERYLTAESRRGMRELQLFLADQPPA